MERAQRGEDGRERPWVFVARLVAVLAATVGFVLLFKWATAPERQLQAVLDAEAAALNSGDWQALEELLDPADPEFRRYQKTTFDSFLSGRERGESWATMDQPKMYVVQAGRQNEQAWALVMEHPNGDPEAGPARIEFFRRVYSEWLHRGPDPNYWGRPLESQTEHITWRYRESDADQVARLAALAEQFTQQARYDVGLDPQGEPGSIIMNLCYSLDCGYVIYPLNRELNLPTPLLFGFDQESLEDVMAPLLVSDVVRQAAGYEENSPAADSGILDGIKRWETGQVRGLAPDEGMRLRLRQAVAAGTLLRLEELSEYPETENVALIYDQAYTVVEYTVAQYGRQILPALVRAAGHNVSPTQALQEALGPEVDLAAFEAGWLAFVAERYGQRP